MVLLSVKSVSKSYSDKEEHIRVLSKISFDLESGEFCSLYGPSGSGKTTLLNIIGGLDYPDEGQVFFEDKKIDSLDEHSIAELRSSAIGIIFQNTNLVSHLNVLENVMLPALFEKRGDEKNNREERAISLLRRLNLEDKMKKMSSKISDGEKRRVSVARCLLTEPKLVLADEPTINLDSENKHAVLKLIMETKERGATVLVATHDEDVSSLSSRTLRIKFGSLS